MAYRHQNSGNNSLKISHEESKVAPVHAMNMHRGSTGITPLVLNLDTRWCTKKNG